jgi:hypothetical protein
LGRGVAHIPRTRLPCWRSRSKTLRTARGCRVELIMKDVHTLHNDPSRLPRWVELARQTIEEEWNA